MANTFLVTKLAGWDIAFRNNSKITDSNNLKIVQETVVGQNKLHAVK